MNLTKKINNILKNNYFSFCLCKNNNISAVKRLITSKIKVCVYIIYECVLGIFIVHIYIYIYINTEIKICYDAIKKNMQCLYIKYIIYQFIYM